LSMTSKKSTALAFVATRLETGILVYSAAKSAG